MRLLLLTRGEAGNAERSPDLDLADTREEEMRCAAAKIGMDEVTVRRPSRRSPGRGPLLDPGRRDRAVARPTGARTRSSPSARTA